LRKKSVLSVEVPQGFAEAPMLATTQLLASCHRLMNDCRKTQLWSVDEIPSVSHGVKYAISITHLEWFTENYDWNSERLVQYSDYDYKTIVGNVFESCNQ
jgi:hypothetical protein